MDALLIESRSESDSRDLGATLSLLLQGGDVVLLHGDLGSGKTVLVQGILAGLGVEGQVASPTFTIMNRYLIVPAVRDVEVVEHIDLYRIEDEQEIDDIAFEDVLRDSAAVVLVEWPERAMNRLPENYLLLEIVATGPETRTIRISHWGESRLLEGLRHVQNPR